MAERDSSVDVAPVSEETSPEGQEVISEETEAVVRNPTSSEKLFEGKFLPPLRSVTFRFWKTHGFPAKEEDEKEEG